MNEFSLIHLITLTGWLILACSSLASYQLSWKSGIRMALIWATIFTGTALVAGLFVQ
ncbi:MAG: hypothetical protein ACK5NN_02600 [Sphingomonadaceae bacterium]